MSATLKPEDSADFLRDQVNVELALGVPDDLRAAFDRICGVHKLGLLDYQMFTVAWQLCLLMVEYALGARFVAFYEGSVPFLVGKDEARIGAIRYSQVKEVLGGPLKKKKPSLPPPYSGHFQGSPSALFSWARTHGLLDGQRARFLERVWIEQRNFVAHPDSRLVLTPVDSAREIRYIAELINRLWGESTNDGHIYPGSVTREVAVQIRHSGVSISAGPVDAFRNGHHDVEGVAVVIRADRRDYMTLDPSSTFETTSFPAEVLWESGTVNEAIAWFDAEKPLSDSVPWIDREFAIRVTPDGSVDRARSIQSAVSSESATEGVWHVVRADLPSDAVAHVRRFVSGSIGDQPACTSKGPCPSCAAETLTVGQFEALITDV